MMTCVYSTLPALFHYLYSAFYRFLPHSCIIFNEDVGEHSFAVAAPDGYHIEEEQVIEFSAAAPDVCQPEDDQPIEFSDAPDVYQIEEEQVTEVKDPLIKVKKCIFSL